MNKKRRASVVAPRVNKKLANTKERSNSHSAATRDSFLPSRSLVSKKIRQFGDLSSKGGSTESPSSGSSFDSSNDSSSESTRSMRGSNASLASSIKSKTMK